MNIMKVLLMLVTEYFAKSTLTVQVETAMSESINVKLTFGMILPSFLSSGSCSFLVCWHAVA